MQAIQILALAGSGRRESVNRRLIERAAALLGERGAAVDLRPFDEFAVPLYHGDLERAEGVPEGAAKLKAALEANDALVFSTPEYNHGVPGTVKNLVDWISRFDSVPVKGVPVLLLSASPSMVGGSRGAAQLRVPLQTLGARVFPSVFSLARAHKAFADDGRIADEKLDGRLASTLAEFADFAGRLTAPATAGEGA